MKFETKAIHGIRHNGEQVNEWGTSINMASTFQIKEYGVPQEFEYMDAYQTPRVKSLRGSLQNSKTESLASAFHQVWLLSVLFLRCSRLVTISFLGWTFMVVLIE